MLGLIKCSSKVRIVVSSTANYLLFSPSHFLTITAAESHGLVGGLTSLISNTAVTMLQVAMKLLNVIFQGCLRSWFGLLKFTVY